MPRPHHASTKGMGWLSTTGAYRPIGTPDLSLVREAKREVRLPQVGSRKEGSDASTGASNKWLPSINPHDQVVDHNTRAYQHLRREIRRSSRAIPACMAGQDLQEVMENPLLHTQTLAQVGEKLANSTRQARRRRKPAAGHKAGGRHSRGARDTASRRKAAVELPVLVPPPQALVANLPQSFVAKSPRMIGEEEEDSKKKRAAEDGVDQGYEDDFEGGDESDDSVVTALLDDMVAQGPHGRNDIQMRVGEHTRNWQLIEVKANSELVDKIESLREKRDKRSSSKLRVAAVGGGGGADCSQREARRHQALWQAKKRRRREQQAFLVGVVAASTP